MIETIRAHSKTSVADARKRADRAARDGRDPEAGDAPRELSRTSSPAACASA